MSLENTSWISQVRYSFLSIFILFTSLYTSFVSFLTLLGQSLRSCWLSEQIPLCISQTFASYQADSCCDVVKLLDFVCGGQVRRRWYHSDKVDTFYGLVTNKIYTQAICMYIRLDLRPNLSSWRTCSFRFTRFKSLLIIHFYSLLIIM